MDSSALHVRKAVPLEAVHGNFENIAGYADYRLVDLLNRRRSVNDNGKRRL
jgi:hypothetical protein